MRDYAATPDCRMLFLRRQLDDPDVVAGTAEPCGRCDRCTGRSLPTEVSPEALSAASAALGRPGVEVEPRKMWPTGLGEVKGRIPADRPGRERPRARAGCPTSAGAPGCARCWPGPTAPVPDEVLGAVVDVLKGWGWAQRPTGVVAVPSRTRPQLVGSLAARLAEVGRLPLLGTLDLLRDVPPGAGRSNSAQRVKAVRGAFGVPRGPGARRPAAAAGRRRRRLRLDAHRGDPRAARGRRRPGAAARARPRRLSGPPPHDLAGAGDAGPVASTA